MTPKRRLRINAALRRVLTQAGRLAESLADLRNVVAEAGLDGTMVDECVCASGKEVGLLRERLTKAISGEVGA